MYPRMPQPVESATWQDLRSPMSEIIFVVEQAPEGGFTARALGEPIHTQAEDVAQLHARVRDVVKCHFDASVAPKMIRLHFVRDEVIAAQAAA
jgi:hypothetical protein